MSDPIVISAAVEGDLDEAVARRLIAHVGGAAGTVYGKNGKDRIRQRIVGYNNAARHTPWLVLVDLDQDFDCAASLCKDWLPSGAASKLCFRVAIRAVEAWMMADLETLARFLGVARSKIPPNPEQVRDPKTDMVNLARSCRRRDIGEDIVPRPGSGRKVGPAYSSLSPKLQEAVQDETKKVNGKRKDRAFFEATMAKCFTEGRRVLGEDGIASVVFAHKTTEGWEALLSGMIRGGWTITGSWPIATEMGHRLRARESAALATSVHLVCRPRPKDSPVGDWGQVIRELPKRVADWMNRLQEEGVRGADLVFACIGPALEIYSRYSKVVDAEEREIPLGGDSEAREPHKRGISLTFGKLSAVRLWSRCSERPRPKPATVQLGPLKKTPD